MEIPAVSRNFHAGSDQKGWSGGEQVGDRGAPARCRRSSGRNCSSAPKSPAIFTWPRMNPTERSSVPSCNACGVGGRRGERDVGGSRGRAVAARRRRRDVVDARPDRAPVPSCPPRRRTRRSSSSSGTVDALARCPANRSSSYSPSGTPVVDERAGERELLPREHLADHVVGEAHPVAVRGRPACGARAAPRAAWRGSRRRR